jgi:hypothetical protein
MILDLCFNGVVEAKFVKFWNQIALDIREEFNSAIEALSEGNQGNIDWWVTAPASRNTIISPLFHYCMVITFLKLLDEKGVLLSNIEVKSDSIYLSAYINEKYPHINVIQKHFFFNKLRKYKFILSSFSHLFGQWLAGKFFNFYQYPQHEEITLVDSYIMDDYIDNDRYYSGLWKSLTNTQKKNFFFVPNLFGYKFWQYRNVYKQLAKSERAFLPLQSYLKLSDYVYAAKHLIRYKKLPFNRVEFKGCEIQGFAKEEISSHSGLHSSVTALLYPRFFARLSEHGIKIKLAINWFENQVCDKAWSYSVNKYYPESNSKGYQGFYPIPLHLHEYPTTCENESRVLPKVISVIGKGIFPEIKKYESRINVECAPAFRYGNPSLFSKKKSYELSVLVALPNMINSSSDILLCVRNVIKRNKLVLPIKWKIKPHPLSNKADLVKILDCNGVEWVDGDFLDVLSTCSILVSGRSQTCMTSIIHGIPVSIIGSSNGLTYLPIPESVDQKWWYVSYSGKELEENISDMINNTNAGTYDVSEEREALITEYFVENNQLNLNEFLDEK